MKNIVTLTWVSLMATSLLLNGCSQRHSQSGSESSDTETSDSTTATGDEVSSGELCTTDADCPDGSTCESGVCVAPPEPEDVPCTSDSDCASDEYCEQPAGGSYDPTVDGTCEDACTADSDCPTGQSCIDGRCYSNYECEPTQNSCDCPGGEVCNGQTRSCTTPPDTCYFNEQCPCEWVCNAQNECADPRNLGNCSADSDCDNVAGCQAGGCECVDGSCQPSGTCGGPGECPTGSYCANGVCQPSPPCGEQADCTPYGLVCEPPSCEDPEPCVNGVCPDGFTCADNYDPPVCLPEGVGECTRDEQCPAGEYCDLFSGTCAPGCRDDADCFGQCPGSEICTCNNARQCVDFQSGSLGSPCSDDAQCPGGTVCAYNDPTAALTCDTLGIGNCDKSCRQVCDLTTSLIIDTCPSGTQCGGDDALQSFITQLLGDAISGSSSASVCY
ncbi:MAG: Dickkopf N-terminal cysteine-rich domain-containing protein [Myxococcota bacterium]|nr:Dickkopf N-terminal cysteine-rich domain-containing protein [Myxococcota bacterium]